MLQIVPYSRARLATLTRGTVVVPDRPALFAIEGPGAVTCVQGIVSHDVVKGGTGSVGYGAMLTAKGAIVADLWSIRIDPVIWFVADRAAREPLLALLRRQLPPRLAKLSDHSDDRQAAWVLGHPAALPATPGPGRAEVTADGLVVAESAAGGWFRALLIGSPEVVDRGVASVESGGGIRGGTDDLRAARVLAGYPTLGAEIGERTLPQEVDFDRLGGVSYTKGCFVGQETVARLHFRGHPNWLLRRASTPWPIDVDEAEQDGKVVARIGTMLQLEDGSSTGLAQVRHEVGPDHRLATPPITFRPIEAGP